MSPAYYKDVFGKNPEYNSQFLNFDNDKMNNKDISNKLMDLDNVINVSLMSDIKKSSEESNANLNMVILVVIIASGSLAFVVLYNLNNVNVSERIRELSTIKVLHAFILYTSETDTMMMYPGIFINSYLLSGIITMFFSIIVMVMIHIKLKKVDMIDALKSNE